MNKNNKKRDYLMFKIRGRIVKVDPDIYYKIRSGQYEPPYRKYNGDITSMRITSEGYPVIVRGGKLRRHTLLSRFVMDAKEGQIIDHRNRDPLDNQRRNLRIVTKRQNGLNKRCKNGSGFIGVCIKHRKGRNYCQAKYQLSNGKELSFQLPDSPHNRVIAAFARDKFVLQAGEEDYAPLNFACFRNEPFRSFLLEEDLRSRAERRSREQVSSGTVEQVKKNIEQLNFER
jgi:hypothetical protein